MKKYIFIVVFFAQSVFGALSLDQVVKLTEGRIKPVEVRVLGFDGNTRKINRNVFDVTAGSFINIFEGLYKLGFPVYRASCYEEARPITEGTSVSLHSYGLAIDINDLMNPYYNFRTHKIVPERLVDREADRKNIERELREEKLPETEVQAVLKVVIQEAGSDDWFTNPRVVRKGMVTDEVVKIFGQNGFDIWGGMWREPVDPQHSQCSRSLADELVVVPYEGGVKIWKKHLEDCRQKYGEGI